MLSSAGAGAAGAGAVFSLSDGGKVTVLVTSTLLEDAELTLELDATGSLAGLIEGLAFSSSLCARSFLTLSSFLRLSSFRSSLVTTRSVFLEYLVGLLIDGTLCFFPVI